MDFLNKHKKGLIFLITFLLLLAAGFSILFKTNATFAENMTGYIVVPMQGAAMSVKGWFSDRAGYFRNINNLKNQNDELLLKVAELEEQNKRLRLYEADNEKLSRLLSLKNKYEEYPVVGARVVAMDPSNWYNVYVINKGTKDGLSAGMLVLSPGGIAGRIIECGDIYSKVVSILDTTSQISAMSIRTEDVGLVKGDSALMEEELCRMEYIDQKAKIIEGDEIVTSHLSGYPPGITIGYVKEIRTDLNGLTDYAIIETEVDFRRLDSVLVVTKEYENP